MKKHPNLIGKLYYLLMCLFILTIIPSVYSQKNEEIIIPMPGEPPPPSHPSHPSNAEILIPLPFKFEKKEKKTASDAALIPIPAKPVRKSATMIVTPSDEPSEIVIDPTIIPSPSLSPSSKTGQTTQTTPTEIKVSTLDPNAPPRNPLPAFPKDTSSAVFMLMKSWECENYDGKVLLEHSIKMYGEEAEDPFTVQGLEALPPFQVTLKEDDITLDELLDMLANKYGFDWGVDIANKIVYLYPNK